MRAEGEAEAATIISRALSKAGDGLVQFRRIEASKEIAGTLASVRHSLFPLVQASSRARALTLSSSPSRRAQGRNVTYLPGGGNVLLQVPSQQ